MKIYIASDHAGYETKEYLKNYFENRNIPYKDLGTDSDEKKADYPLYAERVAERVVEEEGARGVLTCGTGIGMTIVANKIKGVRAAFAFDKYSARKAREHNNSNILVLRGRNFSKKKNRELVEEWLNTEFSSEERHRRRVEEIEELEKNQ